SSRPDRPPLKGGVETARSYFSEGERLSEIAVPFGTLHASLFRRIRGSPKSCSLLADVMYLRQGVAIAFSTRSAEYQAFRARAPRSKGRRHRRPHPVCRSPAALPPCRADPHRGAAPLHTLVLVHVLVIVLAHALVIRNKSRHR